MNRNHSIVYFMAGALCFFIAQPLLRIPLLNALQSNIHVTLWMQTHLLLTMIVQSFTAGLFEETTRLLFRHTLWRNQTVSIKNALLFGLGHGLMEVLLILGPVINHDFLTLFPALFERFFAVLAHMGLSLLIFSMANVGRSAPAWLYAVIMHFLLNIGAVIILRFTGSVLFSEIWIAVVSVFIFGTAWRQAKFMERKLQ